MTGRRRVGVGLAIAGVVVIAAAVVLLLVDRDDPAPSGPLARFDDVAVRIEPETGAPRSTCMLAARTDAERARGLMEVTDPDLDGHDGMVFVYDTDVSGPFWMRTTPMPLSIAYLDAGGRLVSTADMAPCGDSPDCPRYPAAGPYRYAVEVPQGRLDDLGIVAGARVRVGGACP